MPLAREQIHWKSKPYIQGILLFQSFVCSCFWVRVIRESFRGSDAEEEGKWEAGREGGKEMGVLRTNGGGLSCLLKGENEVGGPGQAVCKRETHRFPHKKTARGGFFSENWESFWRWCQKQSICLLRTLPTGREGMVQRANSLCKKERQETGREHSTQWEQPPLNDTGKGRAGAEQAITVPSARETSKFHIYMVFYTLQNAATITLKLPVICKTSTIITLFQMKKLSPRNKWYTWLQAF